jgi:hypothetical protein
MSSDGAAETAVRFQLTLEEVVETALRESVAAQIAVIDERREVGSSVPLCVSTGQRAQMAFR